MHSCSTWGIGRICFIFYPLCASLKLTCESSAHKQMLFSHSALIQSFQFQARTWTLRQRLDSPFFFFLFLAAIVTKSIELNKSINKFHFIQKALKEKKNVWAQPTTRSMRFSFIHLTIHAGSRSQCREIAISIWVTVFVVRTRGHLCSPKAHANTCANTLNRGDLLVRPPNLAGRRAARKMGTISCGCPCARKSSRGSEGKARGRLPRAAPARLSSRGGRAGAAL